MCLTLSFKKILIIFILLLFIFFILFNTNINAEEKLKIAFVPKSLDNPIFLDTFEAAEMEAERLGVELEWVAPFKTSTEGQVKVIKQLIEQDIDGIIISVNDSNSLEKVINEAYKNQIPVITFDSDSPNSKRLCYVGTNNYEVGFEIGSSLIDILNDRGKLKGRKRIMILSGEQSASNLQQRIKGFKDAISKKIDIGNIETLYCKDNIQLAIELVEDHLEQNPDTNIVFFTGGWPFYAPADAMPNFKNWANKEGVAIGIDIFYSALILQNEGLIDFLIGQNFKNMGTKSLNLMIEYLRDSKVPKDFINTGYTISNEENIEELLKIYKPWEVR